MSVQDINIQSQAVDAAVNWCLLIQAAIGCWWWRLAAAGGGCLLVAACYR